jgi:hypothetical protein
MGSFFSLPVIRRHRYAQLADVRAPLDRLILDSVIDPCYIVGREFEDNLRDD